MAGGSRCEASCPLDKKTALWEASNSAAAAAVATPVYLRLYARALIMLTGHFSMGCPTFTTKHQTPNTKHQTQPTTNNQQAKCVVHPGHADYAWRTLCPYWLAKAAGREIEYKWGDKDGKIREEMDMPPEAESPGAN